MKNKLLIISLILLVFNGASFSLYAQQGSSVLKLEDIFKNNVYRDKGYGPIRWSRDSKGYLTFESNQEVGGRDIVMFDAKTGLRTVVCSAKSFIPEGLGKASCRIGLCMVK